MDAATFESFPVFESFPKIGRFNREWVATEKIDGTNAQVYVSDDGLRVCAGSRSRWIVPGDDNFGFAAWVSEHADELLTLGPGRHYGEWWGAGIQRRYGLKERRFSLFNTTRWGEIRPACCGVVPVLATGDDPIAVRDAALGLLRAEGSLAAPGFMDPEGIVLFHTHTNSLYKVTLDGDGHKTTTQKKGKQ